MPFAFKPFGAKAINSFSRKFHFSLIKLTIIYTVLLAVILFLSSSILYSYFSSRLEHRFRGFRGGVQIVQILPPPPTADDVRADLTDSLVLVNSILLLVAGSASYFLALYTLEPLKASYERQQRFLSDASHELRTPLSVLRMDIENELADATAQAKSKQRAASNLEEIDRMHALVEDLLTLSRLDETNPTRRRADAVDFSDLIASTIETLTPLAHAQRVQLTLAHADAGQIRADAELLRRIVQNVIKNAILYNKAEGSVTVSLREERNGWNLQVADTGVGMSKEELEKIFDRFYRVDKSRSRQTGGSGLGLAIVKASLERLGGHIDITSEETVGTTVHIMLPNT